MLMAAAILTALTLSTVVEGLRLEAVEYKTSAWHMHLQTELGTYEAGSSAPFSRNGDALYKPDWIHGLSALRDPKRQQIRLFFDAFKDKAQAVTSVFFAGSAHSLARDGLRYAKEISNCLLQRVSDPDAAEHLHNSDLVKPEDQVEFLDGWQLTCQDPGQEYLSAVIVYDESKYTLFQIETIKDSRAGKVAACMAPLYSARLFTKPWLFYNSKQGVEHFMMYRAKTSNWTTKMTPYMIGIWPSSELRDHTPVEIIRMEGVQWFTYYASPLRYMHSQTTALNDCLMRLRYLYDYVVVTDVDEFIRIGNKAFPNLGTFLDHHFPPGASSLTIPRFTFPAHCCSLELDEASAIDEVQSMRFLESCQRYSMRDHHIGKSIYRPQLADGIYQHAILYALAGSEPRIQVDHRTAHLVHLKREAAWGIPMSCELDHKGTNDDITG